MTVIAINMLLIVGFKSIYWVCNVYVMDVDDNIQWNLTEYEQQSGSPAVYRFFLLARGNFHFPGISCDKLHTNKKTTGWWWEIIYCLIDIQ